MRLKRIGKRLFSLFMLGVITLMSCILVLDVLFINHGPSIEGGNVILPEPLPSDTVGQDSYEFGDEMKIDVFDLYFLEEGVSSNDEDKKVIAPGTRNKHVLYVTNKFDFAIDYELSYTSGFGNDVALPILVKLKNDEGIYLIGSKDTYGKIEDLKNVKDLNTVGSNRYHYYVFEWYWPFERDDDIGDTTLGNLTITEDISVTLNVDMKAVASEDIDSKDGILLPGDKDGVLVQSIATGAAIAIGFIVLVYAIRSKKVSVYNDVD